jgi:hypothetical protein
MDKSFYLIFYNNFMNNNYSILILYYSLNILIILIIILLSLNVFISLSDSLDYNNDDLSTILQNNTLWDSSSNLCLPQSYIRQIEQ